MKYNPYNIGEILVAGLQLKSCKELLFNLEHFTIRRDHSLQQNGETLQLKASNISYKDIYKIQFNSYPNDGSRRLGYLSIYVINDLRNTHKFFIPISEFDTDNFLIPILQLWNHIAVHKMKPPVFPKGRSIIKKKD